MVITWPARLPALAFVHQYQGFLGNVAGIGKKVPTDKLHVTMAVINIPWSEDKKAEYDQEGARIKSELSSAAKEFKERIVRTQF